MSIASFLWRFPSALMAWRNLGRNKVRTSLAALGIVIGVLSIASLGMAGIALQQQATSNLASLTDEVTIRAGPDSPRDSVTDDQVDAIQTMAGDATVVPQRSNATTLTGRNGQKVRVSVTGLTQTDPMYDASAGEIPDRLHSGALISNSTAAQLNLEVGDPVEYDGQLYRIQGIIASEGGFDGGRSRLVLPLSALSEQEFYSSVTILAEDGEAAQQIASRLAGRYSTEDNHVLTVTTFAGAQENVGSFMNTLNLALLGIGSISLIVASVAILNVMLMSTIERRGEIGVLRAVGIRRGEVLRMILTEAGLLGVLGGLVGATVSLIVGLVLFHFLTDDAMLVFRWSSVQYLVLGFGFGVIASLVSGLYPAWKAANDRPVDSLRG